MNLDELRSVQNRERQTDSLQHLRESFYEEVGRYISDLKTERERAAERADDPWSDPEIGRLTDEIETAEEVAESIYERRMGKLVKSASLAAGGYTTDTEGLTLEEERLFETLVERIEENKATVLDVLAGEAADPGTSEPETAQSQEQSAAAPDHPATTDQKPAPEPPAPDRAGDGVDAASMMAGDEGTGDPVTTSEPADDPRSGSGPTSGKSPDSSPPGAPASPPERETTDDPLAAAPNNEAPGSPPPDDADAGTGVDDDPLAADAGGDTASLDDRRTVRITSDIGQILGVDEQEYELNADDVVMLPEENAGPLIERDAAEPIE